jgi:hypothetical protein
VESGRPCGSPPAIGNTSDCAGGGNYCDPVTQRCSFKADAGARCNDFLYPTGHLWDGEWFARADGDVDPVAEGGVRVGGLVFHFDRDPRMGQVAHQDHTLGGGGPCGGAVRAIVCCNPGC